MNDTYTVPLKQLRHLATKLGYEISFGGPHIVLSKPRCKNIVRRDTPAGHTAAYNVLQRKEREATARQIQKLERQLAAVQGGN